MDEQKILQIAGADIPKDIPTGDMPGDRINITEGSIRKAAEIFPKLAGILDGRPEGMRTVISVYGGSGSGKSCVASVLAYMLTQAGMGCYIMSGDNYPRRIPSANDNERLHTFRTGGIRALAADDTLTPAVVETLHHLQAEGRDADRSLCTEYDWLERYISAGTEALSTYIGSSDEIDFDEVNSILEAFHGGRDSIWMKRMGRDEASIWYEKVDVSDRKILMLEWTHGNSRHLKGVDIPVFLCSNPDETLADRISRGRDPEAGSPFTRMVLDIEQVLLLSQEDKAMIKVNRCDPA